MHAVKPTYKHVTPFWFCIRDNKKRPRAYRDIEGNRFFHRTVRANSYFRILVGSMPQFLRGTHREEARAKIHEWFGIDTSLAPRFKEIEKVSERLIRRVQALPIEFRQRAEEIGLSGDSLRLACDAFNVTLAGMIANAEIKGT